MLIPMPRRILRWQELGVKPVSRLAFREGKPGTYSARSNVLPFSRFCED